MNTTRALQWLTIACGIAVFLWMSVEDTQTWPVVVLGGSVSLIAVVHWSQRFFMRTPLPSKGGIALIGLLGGLTGLGTALITALLMLIKNAWHLHPFPDFPPLLMGAILTRAPWWGVAGVLIGLGIGVISLWTKKT
ncbi:MAG: hypothetical protein MUF87_22380 [Anaerolineae bacterium]|jgi:hypothetical protein|nr:hypothetical protein [Anaerolineae bacterium]